MIISHRGHYNGLQENTIPAFEEALKAGAEGVECDLRLTKDHRAIVCHDNKLKLNGKKFKLSKTSLTSLISQNKERDLLTISDLFEYINQKRVPFFLEVKTRSPILIEEIAKHTRDRNLWSYVHIMGFSLFIKNALRAQAKHEKLRVLPIINFPLYSYIRKPKMSYGLFIGWIDQWYGSQWLFRKSISIKRMAKLKKFYEKRGLKVMAGVVNNESGFEYFKQAGITDIVTDNIRDAVRFFDSSHPELVSGSPSPQPSPSRGEGAGEGDEMLK